MILDGDIIVLQCEQHPLKSNWGISEVFQVDLLQGFMVTLSGEGTAKDLGVESFISKDTS